MKNSKKASNFRRLFWHMDGKKLDPKKDKNLIIHQTLAYGSWEDMQNLLEIYGRETVRAEFIKSKAGTYQPAVLALVQFILGAPEIDKSKYIKKIYAATPSRDIGFH